MSRAHLIVQADPLAESEKSPRLLAVALSMFLLAHPEQWRGIIEHYVIWSVLSCSFLKLEFISKGKHCAVTFTQMSFVNWNGADMTFHLQLGLFIQQTLLSFKMRKTYTIHPKEAVAYSYENCCKSLQSYKTARFRLEQWEPARQQSCL